MKCSKLEITGEYKKAKFDFLFTCMCMHDKLDGPFFDIPIILSEFDQNPVRPPQRARSHQSLNFRFLCISSIKGYPSGRWDGVIEKQICYDISNLLNYLISTRGLKFIKLNKGCTNLLNSKIQLFAILFPSL